MRKIRSNAGVTLAELVVSLLLFSIIMLSLSYVMSSGYNYYWTAAGSLEVQKAALFGTRLLAKDLELSNINTVEIQDDTAVPPLDGIVFAMPSDLGGTRSYDERGKIIWQSYVGYYVQNVTGVNTIIRNQQAVAAPSILTPLPSADGVTPTSIAALPSPRVIVSGVEKLDFELLEDVVKVELTGVFEQRGVFSITIRNQMFPRN